MLVVVVSATACGFKAGYDEAAIRRLYWTDPGHLQVLASCSYNKLTVDRASFKVIFVDIPCTVGRGSEAVGPMRCCCCWQLAGLQHAAACCVSRAGPLPAAPAP